MAGAIIKLHERREARKPDPLSEHLAMVAKWQERSDQAATMKADTVPATRRGLARVDALLAEAAEFVRRTGTVSRDDTGRGALAVAAGGHRIPPGPPSANRAVSRCVVRPFWPVRTGADRRTRSRPRWPSSGAC
jgi:hypothetical protein